jgi:hypothetical protein
MSMPGAYDSAEGVVVIATETAHGQVMDDSGVGGWRIRAVLTTGSGTDFVMTFKQALHLGYRLIHDALRAWWHDDHPGQPCPDDEGYGPPERSEGG